MSAWLGANWLLLLGCAWVSLIALECFNNMRRGRPPLGYRVYTGKAAYRHMEQRAAARRNLERRGPAVVSSAQREYLRFLLESYGDQPFSRTALAPLHGSKRGSRRAVDDMFASGLLSFAWVGNKSGYRRLSVSGKRECPERPPGRATIPP